jgi:voltage-gated potassium channel
MTAPAWSLLDRRQRRRQVVTAFAAVTATWVLLLGTYYLIPFTDLTSAQSVVRIVLGIGTFVGVLVWQVRRIGDAELPVLRAVQALGGVIPLLLVAFAAGYLSLSHADVAHFSEPIDHTGALYLTVTIFSTVGFGDITPDGDLARIVVSVQMLLDLVIIGAVVRVLSTAAKGGIAGPSTSGAPVAPDEPT